ncbi:BRCA1-associated protein isoform X2 [Ananas comosus]|uniref:BRCA1-associated protein isoform X2 n=2 Tax=Ananas comosus TaxID=4615 RepID=A0A6P5GRU0_ANACO|nr:BRCA1-associated protein isoform X2 [Ananas comosus]
MFSLRIQSLDSSDPVSEPSSGGAADPLDAAASAATSGGGAAPTTSRNPNPRVLLIRGIVHLYRSTFSPPSSSSSAAAAVATATAAAAAAASSSSSSSSSHPQHAPDSLLPPGRGTLLFVLAVPTRLSPDDFIRFCGPCVEYASEIRVVRNDGMEDRYSVLVEFEDQKSADGFYLDLNGWRFSSSEGEVCHVLFLGSAEYTSSMEIATTPPIGSTELPTCPVCIERLDQDISGIVATTCDHSFQCSCVSTWANSSCPVCQFCQKHADKPTCSICETSENLWICVICGFVGCGRYKEGHAVRHWKDTQHCYSLHLETQRVWDYVGDTYVHRLNQSKSDEKHAKMRSKCSAVGDNSVNCTCSDDSGISSAVLSSRIEAIVDEYNRLLASQLESQKQYYEALLLEAKEEREKHIAEAVDGAVNIKLQDLQLKLENLTKDKKEVSVLNSSLMENQKVWRERLEKTEEREKTTLRMKDEKIRDLEEEIRDFTVFIEAQRTIDKMADADDVKGGMLLPVASQPQPVTTKGRRSSKMSNKKRS